MTPGWSSYRAADLGGRLPPRAWLLMLGPELMAELAFESHETPWITVRVRAQPGFIAFVPYFGDPDRWRDDDPALDAMLAEIGRRGGFKLFDDAGLQAETFSLTNLDEASANLRY